MTRSMQKIVFFDLSETIGQFPGWETVATGKALNETPKAGLDWHYYGVCVSFVRASDKTCIPYGLALFREARSPDGKKKKQFLVALRHAQKTEECRVLLRQAREIADAKKQIEEHEKEKSERLKAVQARLTASVRDEIVYEVGDRVVKNITWTSQAKEPQTTDRGLFHSFDHGTTWVGIISGIGGAYYAGAQAIELMSYGGVRNIQKGVRVCMPSARGGWAEFIIDPTVLVDIPAGFQHDDLSGNIYTTMFSTQDGRRWLLQNCSPQVQIPAGKAPLVIQYSLLQIP